VNGIATDSDLKASRRSGCRPWRRSGMASGWSINDLVSRRCAVYLVVLIGATLAPVPRAQAQEAERVGEEVEAVEEAEYRHVVSLFAGACTHTERNDTGGAIGLSYAYLIAPKWAVGVKAEYASSQLERDVLLLVGVAYEAAERVELAAAIGGERVEKDEVEHGEVHQVEETEALLRLGIAYLFPLSHRVALSLEFNTDIGGSRVTLIYGLLLSVGL